MLLGHALQELTDAARRGRHGYFPYVRQFDLQQYGEDSGLLDVHMSGEFRGQLFNQFPNDGDLGTVAIVPLGACRRQRSQIMKFNPQIRMFLPEHTEDEEFAGTSAPVAPVAKNLPLSLGRR